VTADKIRFCGSFWRFCDCGVTITVLCNYYHECNAHNSVVSPKIWGRAKKVWLVQNVLFLVNNTILFGISFLQAQVPICFKYWGGHGP